MSSKGQSASAKATADRPEYVKMTATPTIEAAGDEKELPRFSMVAYTGGTMRIEGFPHPVVVDLAGLQIPDQNLPIRLDHQRRQGVGHTRRIAVEDGKLIAEGLISRETSWARDVARSGVNGFPWQASIGAEVLEAELVPTGGRVEVNGQQFEGPVHVVRRAVLKEISFVDSGADTSTSAKVAARDNEEKTMKTDVKDDDTRATEGPKDNPPPAAAEDQAARISTAADGASRQDGSAQAEAPAEAGAEQVQAHAEAETLAGVEPKPDIVAEIRNQAVTETERIGAVRRICAGKHPDIEAKAITEGWDETRCELEVLRADRPKAPAVHVPDNSVTGQVLEAACMLTAGLAEVEKIHDRQTLDTAAKRFRGSIGLQELLLEAAWANGYTGRNFRDSRAVLRYAFRPDIQAAFSTIDIGGILSNVANKFLLEGFFSVERTWRNICAVRNVSDFKTVTSYRLIGTDQYELVAPGGELKHGTLGEESYTNKADTYGLLLSVDRRDVINDDLGAITTVPRKLGRGSGLKINDIFWAVFLDNSGFFKTANKNYISGAGTALSIDGLTAAEVTFMDQTDADGKPIGIMPAIMLVPTALSAVATQLYKSLEIRDTTSSTKYPIANPHQGKFRSEVSRYLSNSSYTGNSAKAWYLLADAADLPVIEVAFLNGQESPTIETAEADFNVLGIQMRGYHDFGVALQDPKGGVKSKGEA